MGRCPHCQEWNTMEAVKDEKRGKAKSSQPFTTTSFAHIPALAQTRTSTGLYELDRVLGGGIVPGGVMLLTGEPGVGKSTLLLQAIAARHALYVSGEESPEQVKERAIRLGTDLSSCIFSQVLDVDVIVSGIEAMKRKPELIIIDSIQTVYASDIDAVPGSISQLRETSSRLIAAAKRFGIPMIIVGHITKGGDIAGPKTLEHMVDTVLHFEGERVSQFRVLRAAKNRFGTTDEIGIFVMKKKGLFPVEDPLALASQDGTGPVPGKAIVGISEGKRPMFYEIQALVTRSYAPAPRRVVKGLDFNKVILLLAVMEKHLKLPLHEHDVFLNVVGGIDIRSPASDLGIVAAILSSYRSVPLQPSTAITGEVGLLGEVRPTYGQTKILTEAARLGLRNHLAHPHIKTVGDLMKR